MLSTPSPAEANPPTPQPASPMRGSIRIGRLLRTDLYVHWSWFPAAFFLYDRTAYTDVLWSIGEYVAGFVVILLHEMGHVLACRRVGGTAKNVVLWPLGGLAFVSPPLRPGALFWTIAAGPFVNLVLAPLCFLAAACVDQPLPDNADSNLFIFLDSMGTYNVIVLVFNLLPVYPLDGGQILQSLLWFAVGRTKSLSIAAGLGLIAAVGMIGAAIAFQEWWFILMGAFLALGAFGGLRRANLYRRQTVAERRPERTCPACGAHPPVGEFWQCQHCRRWIDLFGEYRRCPNGVHLCPSACFECGHLLDFTNTLDADLKQHPSN